MTASNFYRPSGEAPIGGILMTLVGGLVAAAVLGRFYGAVLFWNGFVYINPLLTVALGVGLAAGVGFSARLGKIRNRKIVSGLAVVIGLLASLVQWSVWAGKELDLPYADFGELWRVGRAISATGTWSVFGWTPTGPALWVTWGVEALIIVGIAAIRAGALTDLPFCEASGKWAKQATLRRHFAVNESTKLADSPGELLKALKPTSNTDKIYAEVTVATVKGSEFHCVCVHNVIVKKGKSGKKKKLKTPVLRFMIFDADNFRKLLHLGGPIPG